ncbi:xanthine dehydrogenase family protein subunit M [Ammoniphilus sp. YIM 78166]|uniref:FAD binding domain-containing protein n=1 Tax=Ammoniphilus sp. YIM 78166 TaxID=1644106 RepID=UPI00106F4225|nr:xanthine dehydrogenase family protein subunit M [Ammoniphilus sp. YIM 78166]
MFIHEIDYHSPNTVQELLDLLDHYKDEAKLLAGGTDLILQLKLNRWSQKTIINVKELPGLNQKRYDGDHFVIGCNTTLTELLDTTAVELDYRALWHAISELADVQCRNRGTLTGNICNASPAADSSPVLLAYDARVVAVSVEGQRTIPMEEFFAGPGRTTLRPNEFAREIHIPKPAPTQYCSFQKLGRTYDDIALLNSAVKVEIDPSTQICSFARVTVGAAAPTAFRATEAEQLINGNPLNEEVIKAAAQAAAEQSRPITDVRASASYRKKMVGVLVERALRDILAKAER